MRFIEEILLPDLSGFLCESKKSLDFRIVPYQTSHIQCFVISISLNSTLTNCASSFSMYAVAYASSSESEKSAMQPYPSNYYYLAFGFFFDLHMFFLRDLPCVKVIKAAIQPCFFASAMTPASPSCNMTRYFSKSCASSMSIHPPLFFRADMASGNMISQIHGSEAT